MDRKVWKCGEEIQQLSPCTKNAHGKKLKTNENKD